LNYPFDHSDWEFETKKLAGWVNNKTKVVGNPKFDNVFDNIDIDYIIDKYDLNQNKKNVLVYGSMEHEMRTNLFSELKHMRDNLSNDFEILYRPHPAEFLKFKDEFNPNFCIDGVKVIDNDMDVKSISNFSDFHVSMFQGVAYNSLIYDKKLINVQKEKRQSLKSKFLKTLLDRDGNCCFYTNKEMTEDEMSIEHLIPLSKGGKNNIDNLVLCIEEENQKMADKPLIEKINYKINNLNIKQND